MNSLYTNRAIAALALLPVLGLNLWLDHFNMFMAIGLMFVGYALEDIASTQFGEWLGSILFWIPFVLPCGFFWVLDAFRSRLGSYRKIVLTVGVLFSSGLFWLSAIDFAEGYHGPNFVHWSMLWSSAFAAMLVAATVFAVRAKSKFSHRVYSWLLVVGTFTWLFPYLGEYP